MTKPAKEVIAQQEVVATPSVVDEEQSDKWLRDSALAYAINHHKNNGGMTTPVQVVNNAAIFLAFLKGEDK